MDNRQGGQHGGEKDRNQGGNQEARGTGLDAIENLGRDEVPRAIQGVAHAAHRNGMTVDEVCNQVRESWDVPAVGGGKMSGR